MKANFDRKSQCLYDIVFGGGNESSDEDDAGVRDKKRGKPTCYKPLPAGNIDYDSPACRIAVRPDRGRESGLTDEARSSLNKINPKISAVDEAAKLLLQLEGSSLADRVEVVEIVDINNPACLFNVPGGGAPLGVIAKRDFLKDEPIMCYGGHLVDDEDLIDDFESYIFNADFVVHELWWPPSVHSGH